MNIDLQAMLHGQPVKTPGKSAGLMSHSFDELMEEAQAQLIFSLPMLSEEPHSPERDGLPERVEPEEPGAKKEDESAMPGVMPLMPVEAEAHPGWQLQQVVAGKVAESVEEAEATVIGPLTPGLRPGPGQVPVARDGSATMSDPKLALAPAFKPALAEGGTPVLAVNAPVQNVGTAPGGQGAETVESTPLVGTLQQVRDMLPAEAAVRPQPVAASLPQSVGSPEWQQSLSQHLATFTRNGIHHAEIRLHPEELGALQINVRMQQEHAQLHIVSDHPHVRQALEAALPQLRAALAESGVQLGQTNVSGDSAQSASAQSGGQQHGQGKQAQGEAETTMTDEHGMQPLPPSQLTRYGINTFA